MATVLVDTGVWYALLDPKDRPELREQLDILGAQLQKNTVVIPWPITYETLRSKFVKNRLALEGFERVLKAPNSRFLDDSPYRDAALEHSLESSLKRGRPLSLVDCMLRVMMDDSDTRIDYLATFNVRDFHDVCTRRKISLLPGDA